MGSACAGDPAPPVARRRLIRAPSGRTNQRNGLQGRCWFTLNKETSMKLILATILAGSFLVSLPVKADDKPPAGDSKSDKSSKKKDKKSDKKAEGDKGAAPAGGGW
jgi:hypothetical protein